MILKILSRGPTYGYAMFDEIKRIFEMDIPKSLVYMSLRRLESKGLVCSEWDLSGRGPARRIYHITEDGKEMLSKRLDCLRKFMRICERILKY